MPENKVNSCFPDCCNDRQTICLTIQMSSTAAWHYDSADYPGRISRSILLSNKIKIFRLQHIAPKVFVWLLCCWMWLQLLGLTLAPCLETEVSTHLRPDPSSPGTSSVVSFSVDVAFPLSAIINMILMVVCCVQSTTVHYSPLQRVVKLALTHKCSVVVISLEGRNITCCTFYKFHCNFWGDTFLL